MGCGCKKRKEPVVVSDSQPQLIEIPKVEMVPETKDWYNNIDIIEPIPQTPDELLAQELNNWNGGQTKN
jgi:hypothetical protein